MPLLPHLDPQVEGIVTRIQAIARYLKRHRAADLAEHGLERWQYDILHHLAATGPPYRATPSQLASRLHTHPATLTNRLDRMEEAGHVSRVHDAHDRRKLLVTLTDEGRALWKSALRGVGKEERQALSLLSAKERDQLEKLLRRMVHAVEDDENPLMPPWP